MLHEGEQRAAELAVAHYGADARRVSSLKRRVEESRGRGETLDLLELFLQENILTVHQLKELRFGLQRTHVDGRSLQRPPSEELIGELRTPLAQLKQLGVFRILRLLGEGGMGAVFLAYNEKESKQVALKVLAPELAKNQNYLDRFYREARSGAILEHPNIVRISDLGRDRPTGLYYLIMEYVDGVSAQDLLDAYGRLPIGDAVRIALDVACALQYAHERQIVHRDIKPANILLDKDGTAKLTDLGLAKRMDDQTRLTLAKQGFGTPQYMPYEQALNAKYADQRSDIFALGATLYHLATGQVPFAGDNPVEILDKKSRDEYPAASSLVEVPESFDAIMSRMLAKEPDERFASATELIAALEATGLAAKSPSFVKKAPIVRSKGETPATQPDLRVETKTWHIRVHGSNGKLSEAKRTTQQVADDIKAGRLTRRAEAAAQKDGPFQSLDQIAEFSSAFPRGKTKSAEGDGFLSDPHRVRWLLLTLLAVIVLILVAVGILSLASFGS